MSEKRNAIDYLTKKNVLKFLKKFGLTCLILSPILIFLGSMALYQILLTNAKNPFVQWSGNNPKTEAMITWETSDPESSTVWFGIDEIILTNITTESASVTIHRILLTSLEPGTKYYYRVGVAGTVPTYRSEIFSFSTAPNNTNTDFNFIAFSDSQQFLGIGWHKRICDAIAGYNDISFVTEAGDICQNWGYKPDWNQFFIENTVYMNRVPFVPNTGNHDGYYPEDDPDSTLHQYEQYFGAVNETADPHTFYYSFNWSNTLFAVCEIAKGGDENINVARNIQHDKWLNQTLENAQDKAFRVIMFHRQVFSSEGNNNELITRITPIVEKYNVSLVLYGHHHHYERFLYNNHTYICLGGGGGQQFGVTFYEFTDYTKSFAFGPSYTKISITGTQMSISTLSPENDVIDSCILKLQGSQAILQE